MKKKKLLLISVLILSIVALFTGGVIARYIEENVYGNNEVSQEDFFFTTDLMHNEYTDLNEESTNTLSVPVYGEVENTDRLVFSIINYYDDLRINSQQIRYTIKIEDTNDSVNYSVMQNSSVIDSSEDDVTSSELTIGIDSNALNPATKVKQDFKVAATGDVSVDTTVTVTISATAPFQKTLKIIFELHPDLSGVRYKIEDAPGNLYVELVIMNGEAEAINSISGEDIFIDVSAVAGELLVDESNSGIAYTIAGGKNYPDQIEVTSTINHDGSFSVLFFKTNTNLNYSTPETLIVKDGNSDYNITLTSKK